MSDLQKEFNFYLKNQDSLVAKYEGKYLVIKDESVFGAYESEIDAYEDAKSKFELGTFIIKPCLPKQLEEAQVFHTRAYF